MTDEKKFKIEDKRRFDSDGNVREGESEDNKEEAKPADKVEKEEKKDAGRELPPIDFSTFILSLGTSAQMQLGLIPNPISKKVEKDLQSAKQTIDIIGLLEDKTRGNLNKDEEGLLKELLYSLRIQYLEAKKVS